jgi:hypothetical protein
MPPVRMVPLNKKQRIKIYKNHEKANNAHQHWRTI